MKKIASIILIAVMVFALSSTALAAGYTYDAETGCVSGDCSDLGLTGWVETYVNGEKAGGEAINFPVTGEGPFTVEVYEDFELVGTYVAEAPAVDDPTDEPPVETEEPTDPVDPPVETDEPVAPVEPTEPTAPQKPADNGKDPVPKTGESNFVLVLLGVIALASIAVVVVSKKNVGKN